MKVNAGTAYYVKNDTEYKKGGESFTAFAMTAPVSVSATKYHKIEVQVDASSLDAAADMNNQTLTATIANAGFDGYIKEGDNLTVQFGGIESAIGSTAINANLTSSTGVTATSGSYAASPILGASVATNPGDDTVTFASWTNADVVVIYTLTK